MLLFGKTMRIVLRPVSWIYGVATGVRNLLFDGGIIKSRKFPIPTVCVGNLTVGGTGKTPHVEYLLRLLHDKMQVAVVSRGYRRKTKGLVFATPRSSAAEIGDEPFQMKRKFPDVHLVADANRCEAIDGLLQDDVKPGTETVVLDDAYQHRYVNPGMCILLVDYARPVFTDCLLPAGMLRESFSQRRRADIIIATKCPENLSRGEREAFAGKMKLLPGQKIFFTSMAYGLPRKLFANTETTMSDIVSQHSDIIAMAGIARPQTFFDEVKRYAPRAVFKAYGDHYNFSGGDINGWENYLKANPGAAILTTEKDGARLLGLGGQMSETLCRSIYTLPIEVEFLFGEQNKFNDIILDYVGKDKRDGGFSRPNN